MRIFMNMLFAVFSLIPVTGERYILFLWILSRGLVDASFLRIVSVIAALIRAPGMAPRRVPASGLHWSPRPGILPAIAGIILVSRLVTRAIMRASSPVIRIIIGSHPLTVLSALAVLVTLISGSDTGLLAASALAILHHIIVNAVPVQIHKTGHSLPLAVSGTGEIRIQAVGNPIPILIRRVIVVPVTIFIDKPGTVLVLILVLHLLLILVLRASRSVCGILAHCR